MIKAMKTKHPSLPDFAKAHVLVVGDIMLDRYWSGSTQRISPEAPIPVVQVLDKEDRVGGAGNVALNISSLGAHASILAITGDDEAADILYNKLQAAEVKCHFERVKSLPTITKLRVMSRHQQLVRLDFEQSLANTQALEALKKTFKRLIREQKFGAIIFSDYAKGTLAQVAELIALAKAASIPVLVDPKGKDFSIYRGANLITPNRSEFETVVGVCADEKTIEQKAQALIQQFEFAALLVTRSEEGMSLLQDKQQALHFPARATEVFDVTGAGDTVIATLGAAFACRSSLADAVQISNLAAGIVVAKSGTAAINVHELAMALNFEEPVGRGLLSAQQAKQFVSTAQKNGESVVMTNGCFDIIHAGHISYLEEAKRLGDRLIVAVNSDESVKRLKGEARPINTLERRMQVLAGLKAVDWVVSFSEDTPADLVANILPDILVKGGDWKVEEIAGGEAVVANGGKVMSLSFKEGHSTTAIIDIIKEREKR